MSDHQGYRRFLLSSLCAVGMCLVGCRNSSLFNVASPVGFIPGTALDSPDGAAEAFIAARDQTAAALTAGEGFGVLEMSELLSDEMSAVVLGGSAYVDARADEGSTLGGASFAVAEELIAAQSALSQTEAPLATYEIGDAKSRAGEAYALTGYVDVFLAEDYCAGVPLSRTLLAGGVVFGKPLTTDSLLGVAEAYFDSALASAYSNDTVTYLASIGLGRTLLDRDSVAAAATAVASVPPSFVFNLLGNPEPSAVGNNTLQQNLYGYELNAVSNSGCAPDFTMANQEGGNGLNFVNAKDPRVALDSTLSETCDYFYDQIPDSVWYYPEKFGDPVNSGLIPLASGMEGALIQAEAALAAGNPGTWLTDLNALRNTGCTVLGTDTTCTLGTGQVAGQTVGLPNLVDPGTTSAEASLMFRERAFWLYGTGSRLGDMRRQVRQYGFSANTVFPVGTYLPVVQAAILANPGNNPGLNIGQYGTEVSLPLPPPNFDGFTTVNPYYQGCTTSTDSA